MPEPLEPTQYMSLVRVALAEDLGPGDITTHAVVPPEARVTAVIEARADCVIAGLDVARAVFLEVDPLLEFTGIVQDGERCRLGDRVATVTGAAAGVLTAERTALNFLQHLSGIATRTRQFVDAAGGALVVLDTRKTIPGMRALAKYAVRCGGGANHRVGLHDGILLKDNHIRIAGGIQQAVARVRAAGSTLPIEVEAESLEDVDAALRAGADVIMLDNMDDPATHAAIARIGRRARVELSGNMSLDRLRALAESGADCVSIGAITHSAPAADLSLEIEHHVRSSAR